MASSLSLVVLSIVPLLLINQSLAASDTSLVTRTCNTTQHPDICLAAFKSYPRSAEATNTTELSRIAIQLSASKSNETFSYVSKLVNSSSDYGTWAKLVLCKDVYNSSTYDVGVEGLKQFDNKNFTGAYESVGSVNSAAVQCNNMGLDMLAERNSVMLGFSEVVMTIIHSLF